MSKMFTSGYVVSHVTPGRWPRSHTLTVQSRVAISLAPQRPRAYSGECLESAHFVFAASNVRGISGQRMQYPSPDQPFAVKAINRMGAWGRRIGIGTSGLDADALMREAKKKTGLSDFGDESFLPGLQVLIRSLNEEARLSTIGRIAAKSFVLVRLKHRLQLIDYRKRRSEVAEQQIERPLFVLGLPRTGTTIFYELLAQDPNHRWPITYEVEQPFPTVREESLFTDPRIAAVDKQMNEVEKLAPGFRAIHEMGATLPQECIAMTSLHFTCVMWGASFFIPSYDAWLREQDGSGAYRWHRMFLQHLQVDYSKPRWLLKTPGHLPFIRTIVDEYPGAMFVQTHRDPMRVIASMSSLACSLHSAFSDEVDPQETAVNEVAQYTSLLKAGMEQRDELEAKEGPDRFFDVQFDEILKRPLEIIEELYEHFGLEWNENIRERMHNYLKKRPREKHGKHHYTLQDFGLSLEEHGPLFADYCERFGLTAGER